MTEERASGVRHGFQGCVVCGEDAAVGKALQNVWNTLYLLLGLDRCFGTVPAHGASGGVDRHHGGAYVALPPKNDHPVLGIGYGAGEWRVMAGFHWAVAVIVRSGNPVVVDAVLLDAVLLNARARDHY